jgi:uncharacterized protein (DUF4213/DUF364 family)
LTTEKQGCPEMKIIADLIRDIDSSADAPVRAICQGAFQTAVRTSGCGLASTPHEPGNHHNGTPVEDAGQLAKRSARDLATMAYSSSPFEAAIGMATINSLLAVDEGRCTEINAAELLAEKGRGQNVVLIGHFPFVQKLRTEVRNLWVIERQPSEGDFTESTAEQLVPKADVVGITGAALINHTMERLLELCHPEAYVVVLGGTAPLSPVLFDHGVDAVAGSMVTDPETVLRSVSQGATFRQIKGVRRLVLRK